MGIVNNYSNLGILPLKEALSRVDILGENRSFCIKLVSSHSFKGKALGNRGVGVLNTLPEISYSPFLGGCQ